MDQEPVAVWRGGGTRSLPPTRSSCPREGHTSQTAGTRPAPLPPRVTLEHGVVNSAFHHLPASSVASSPRRVCAGGHPRSGTGRAGGMGSRAIEPSAASF